MLQAIWGHRYPIFEGPAGVWFSTFMVLSGMALQIGKPLSVLRTDLETGLMVAGILTILLGVYRLMPLVRRLFTPLVNGVFLILLALQFSYTMIKGLLEPSSTGGQVLALNKVAVFFVTIGITFFVSLKSRGFLQSIAVLVGSTVGWIVALLLGLMPEFQGSAFSHLAIFSFPNLMDWGTPTFDPLITLTSVIAGLVVLSNLVASVAGMQKLTGDPDSGQTYNRTAICTGIADIIAGLGCVVGFVPFASSVGFAALTGIFDRIPFIIGSTFQILLGIIPAVGYF